MSQFSINFVTDEGDLCLTRPARERFHIGAIKHAPGWITGRVHEQDAGIRPVIASPGHRLRKGLWGQTMMIMWLGLHSDHSSTSQACHRSIADPRRNRQQDIPLEDVQERIEQWFAAWTDRYVIGGKGQPTFAGEVHSDDLTQCRYPQHRCIARVCCGLGQCRFQQGMQWKRGFAKAQMDRLTACCTPLRYCLIHGKRCRGWKCVCCRCQVERYVSGCFVCRYVLRVGGIHGCFLYFLSFSFWLHHLSMLITKSAT